MQVPLLTGLLGLLLCSPVEATQVFRWVDAQGVVQFSDAPPTVPVADILIIDTPVFARGANPDSDYYSIVNQNRRMEQSRLAREKLRAEQQAALEKLKLERERIALQSQRYDDRDRGYAVWGWGGYRGGYYRPRYPRYQGRHQVIQRYPYPNRPRHRTSRLMPPRGRGISTGVSRRPRQPR